MQGLDAGKIPIVEDLLEVLEPFIPLVISQESLYKMVAAYDSGDNGNLAQLEKEFVNRSKFVFINSILWAKDGEWGNIVTLCRKIRHIKLQQLVPAK